MSAVRRWAVEGGRTDLVRPAAATSPVEVATRRGSVRFDAARTAFVVVDMQNDFCHPGGWLASIGVDVSAARSAIGPINRLSPLLRSAGVPVLWLDWGTRADRVNLPPNVIHVYDPEGVGAGIGAAHADSPAVLEEGSWGAALVDELDVRDDDIRVSKHRMSGFWDTPLDSTLRTLGIDTVLFAGVNLDQCVYATLIDAACLGYDCILVEQASATTSPGFCVDATVYNVDQCFGFCVAAADLELALTTEGHH
ncbi:cysteine hydrolase [Cnuibacter physcomitrellae]|uniref:cysteine hydrolase family protein n=1 Tax=Cnuibacter physcomitrellae TaxID=1619308 RepID=UPI002175B36D|nr:isochorismatase family cysteine hydrolase [Cnuibacter physcomitrellae]MCS5496358.1 cysteine hydrolase [Cnuibacter physcomitrellae]